MNKIELLKLPKIENLKDLNHLLLFTEKQLNDFVRLKSEQYVSFKIPKKNSIEKRIINAPKKYLKLAQKIILNEILEKVPCSNAATAFIKNKNGLFENANMHKDNLYLLKFDFCNFFQSIKFERIRLLFIELGYNPKISKILAELCTYCKELPQGGICSPCLSNLICLELDNDLLEYCEGNDIKYTRYADDLFFSSNNKEVLLKLKEEIERLILKHRTEFFDIKINGQKTKFITEPWHKKVTGITINNNKIKTSKTLKRDIRRELYFTIIKNKTDYNKLIGQIAFVISIEKDYAEKIKKYALSICEKNNIHEHKILQILDKMVKSQV